LKDKENKTPLINMDLTYEMEVRDKDNNLIAFQRKQSRSLLKNFLRAIRGLMYGTAQYNGESLVDTSGITRTYPYISAVAQEIFCTNSPITNANYGIIVGTGVTVVNRDQYALAAKIAHGNGSGQLMYGASTLEACDGTPPDTQFRIIRTFTNDYSGAITVNEIGLAFYQLYGPYYFLIARDLATQLVPIGATLTVRYILKVTA